MGETDDLSTRQRETLLWVENFIRQNRMPPTVREIGDAFGIKSSSVFDLLKALERKGYIRREPRKATSIVILDAGPEKRVTSASSLSPNPANGSKRRSRNA